MQEIEDCGPPQFKENQVAPAPTTLPPSGHAVKDANGNYDPAVPHYDHEFGGFTAIRTWETKCPYPPGTYTVKFVIHDVADGTVDAALFMKQDSLKLYRFLPADFDLDGDVDGNDFLIWQRNQAYGVTHKKFTEGDANGDGAVTTTDLNILSANWGAQNGNRDLKFDFDRDNDNDGQDFLIWQRNLGLTSCASRFEGDSDGNGAVNGADNPSGGSAVIASPCSGGGQSLAAGGGGGESDNDKAFYDAAIDIDQDGDVDKDDVDLFGKTVAAQ